MGAQSGSVGFRCLLLLALFGCTRSEGVQTCEEVRKLFQWRLAEAVKGLPESPRADLSPLDGVHDEQRKHIYQSQFHGPVTEL